VCVNALLWTRRCRATAERRGFAGAFPPRFDSSCVVSVACEVEIMAMEDQEGPGEKLKGDSFGPPDVAALGVPVFKEGPRTPIFSHNDAKAHSGAYI
jgi:hypothetical protein